jgi:hypothetical protein
MSILDPKYKTLIAILDSIRKEAPVDAEYKAFRSRKPEDIQFSRGQAFIHLFLLVKFGIEKFEARSLHICDGPQDGGLDAYYISEELKTVFLIQSKFKNTGKSFEGQEIPSSDLVKMELDRILIGQSTDSNNVEYNPKVLKFQATYKGASTKQVYQPKVIILANIRQFNDYQIRKLTSNLDYEIFDFERSYLELVKPVCSGTSFDPDKIIIQLGLSGKTTPQLNQSVETSYGSCEVTAVFVPTAEIGRVMSKYKNAILRYNPRNYLGLSKNPVNKEIKKSICDSQCNDFALLNNGITILADEQQFTVYTAAKNLGTLILTNPQIINGGQTAYTLSEIFDSEYPSKYVFDGKEVLVRVVVIKQQDFESKEKRHKFISSISTSTNQQTLVKEADRHSTNPLLVSIQDGIFRKYGFFLELKSGEYYDGRARGFVNRSSLIDRSVLLRSYIAFSGKPTPARRHSEPQLYEDPFFNSIFNPSVISNMHQLVSEIMCAYWLHCYLVSLEKQLGKKSLKYGYATRYGKYAVVYASALSMVQKFRNDLSSRSLEQINQYIDNEMPQVLARWKEFELSVQKLPENKKYFDPEQNLNDFDTYYKGTTLKDNLEHFFSVLKLPQ